MRGMEKYTRKAPKKLLRRKRAFLTISAIAISMALLVSMLSIAQGIVDFTYSQIIDSKEDIAITGLNTHGVAYGHTLAMNLSRWREVEAATPSLEDIVSLNVSGRKGFCGAEGVIPQDMWHFLPDDQRDRFHGWFAEPADVHFGNGSYDGPFTGEILVSRSTWDDFALSEGSKVNISRTSNGQEWSFTVKGYFETDFGGTGVLAHLHAVVLHLSELQTVLDLDTLDNDTVLDVVDRVSVDLRPEDSKSQKDVDRVIFDIEEQYPIYKDGVLSKKDRLAKVEGQVAIANAYFMSIGLVSTFIGTLFVACIMVMSIFERTNIIGMMRAIGISRWTIFLQTFGESIGLIVLGALVGVLPGYLGADLMGTYLSSSYGFNFSLISFNMVLIGKAFLVMLAVGSLSSVYPAWLATKMNVIKALRHVG